MNKNNVTTTLKTTGTKISKKAKALMAGASGLLCSAMMTINSYASGGLNIDTSYTINTGIAETNPEGMIIGLAVWVCRLVGIGMLIWGIYGYVTARKDGEAEAMNGAIGKLVAGLVLVCMAAVLRGLSIIA